MEKFLKAATLAWNPIGEVRQRLSSGTLSVSAVLIPVVAAVIACNLFRMAAWNFFWDTALRAVDPKVEKLHTSEFVVQFGSAVGALVTVAVLALLPARVFQPYGRSAVAAALLIVLAANAFYSAAIAAPVYFVAGSFAFQNLQLGLRTFESINLPMTLAVVGLTLFFWCRISLSVLSLDAARMVGITVVVALGFAVIVGLGGLLLFAASSAGAG
jgi:hypothetical protein